MTTVEQQVSALMHRAHTGLLAACMEQSKRAQGVQEANFTAWQGYARALRDIERGAGTALAQKDAGLQGYETPRYLQAAAGCLGDDIYRLTRVEVLDRLAQAGLQFAPDALAGLDLGATHELEDGVVAALDGDREHAALVVDVGDGAGGHGAAPAEGAAIVPPAPGQYWPEQAAWYAGPVAYPDGRIFALLLPDGFDALGQLSWGKYGKAIKGADSLHDGVANTADMAKAGCTAAKAVLAHNPDWYLPSRMEALQLFATLKAQVGEEWAWTSTQYSARLAWCQGFGDGSQYFSGKDAELRAVAVRRLVLQSFSASTGGAA